MPFPAVPLFPTYSDLASVSCASNKACTAVGGFTVADSGQLTLAERWTSTG